MEKSKEKLSYELEVLWRNDYCYKIEVSGEASFYAEEAPLAASPELRFLNVLQAGLSLEGSGFLLNGEREDAHRRKFFEKHAPRIKDLDLGIKSVYITAMDWNGKEEIKDQRWASALNELFAEMYPQTAELCLDEDQEIEA